MIAWGRFMREAEHAARATIRRRCSCAAFVRCRHPTKKRGAACGAPLLQPVDRAHARGPKSKSRALGAPGAFAAFPLCDIFHSENPVSMDTRSAYEPANCSYFSNQYSPSICGRFTFFSGSNLVLTRKKPRMPLYLPVPPVYLTTPVNVLFLVPSELIVVWLVPRI